MDCRSEHGEYVERKLIMGSGSKLPAGSKGSRRAPRQIFGGKAPYSIFYWGMYLRGKMAAMSAFSKVRLAVIYLEKMARVSSDSVCWLFSLRPQEFWKIFGIISGSTENYRKHPLHVTSGGTWKYTSSQQLAASLCGKLQRFRFIYATNDYYKLKGYAGSSYAV